MSDPYAAEYERLYADYQQRYQRIVETQRRLREISCTATSPRKSVSVTVGHGGVVTDVSFPTSAYKQLPPAELASVVLETITAARELATAEAATIVAPSVPEGVNVHALLSGSMDLQSLLPKDPDVSDATREMMTRME
jgi:hypothetical protein